MRKLLFLVGPLALLGACATLGPTPDSDDAAQDRAHLYFKTLRWEGPRASAALLAPELRREYLDRINAESLEKKIKITDFDVKELGHLSKNAVTLGADLSWYLEPGVTVKHEEVTLHLEFRNGSWMVTGIDGGPLPIAPLTPAPAQPVDGGAP